MEIPLPDITAYRDGNTGVEYAIRIDGSAPGPRAMITGLTHGNEICGAVALDHLLGHEIRPARGSLTLCFANAAAFRRFSEDDPGQARYLDEDLNRIWEDGILDGAESGRERARAREMRPLVAEADYLLDIHSMLDPGVPLILCGPHEKGRRLAARLGYPGTVIADDGHGTGTRLRDYGAFADPKSPKNALLVECGQHWQAETARVAVRVAFRFLAALDMIDGADHAECPPPEAQRFLEVTETVAAASARFAFVRPFKSMELIEKAGTLIATDDTGEIRTPHDDCTLVMPARQIHKGHTALRLAREVAPPEG